MFHKKYISSKIIFSNLIISTFFISMNSYSNETKKNKDIKIAVVTHGESSDAYWTAVKKGVDAAGKNLGIPVSYQAPNQFDGIAMSRMIDAAIAAKVDGLVVSIPDANALSKSIKSAVAAGIPVVTIDAGKEEGEKLGAKFFVGGSSNFDSGKQAGIKMAQAGVKKAICINHEVGNHNLDERCEGFAKGLGKNVSIVSVNLDPTETSKRVSVYLDTHKDINGIITLGPVPAITILKILKQKKILNKYIFGTFDLSSEILNAISKDEILFGIDSQQYLMGYLPVTLLAQNAMYGTLPVSNIYTGPNFITKTDSEKILELSKKGLR